MGGWAARLKAERGQSVAVIPRLVRTTWTREWANRKQERGGGSRPAHRAGCGPTVRLTAEPPGKGSRGAWWGHQPRHSTQPVGETLMGSPTLLMSQHQRYHSLLKAYTSSFFFSCHESVFPGVSCLLDTLRDITAPWS